MSVGPATHSNYHYLSATLPSHPRNIRLQRSISRVVAQCRFDTNIRFRPQASTLATSLSCVDPRLQVQLYPSVLEVYQQTMRGYNHISCCALE